MDNTTAKPKSFHWDWRSFFSTETIRQGERDESAGKLIDFDISADKTRAVGRTQSGFYVFAKNIPTSYHEAVDCPRWDRLSDSRSYYYPDANRKDYYSCSCSVGMNGVRCRHLANLMFRVEKERGPFLFTETEQEKQERLRAEEEEKERMRQEAEARRERERLEKERLEKERLQNFALTFLQKYTEPVPQGITFPPDTILKKAEMLTNIYETEQAERYLNNDSPIVSHEQIVFNSAGTQSLSVEGSCDQYEVSLLLGRNDLLSISCECGRSHLKRGFYWSRTDSDGKMCVYSEALHPIVVPVR